MALRGLMPERFESAPATITAFSAALGTAPVLVALRAIAADYLGHLPTPLGFHHRPIAGGALSSAMQHPMGPDPPVPRD